MSLFTAFQFILEVAGILLLCRAFLREDKFIAFEDKLIRAARVAVRNHRRRKIAMHERKIRLQRQALERTRRTTELKVSRPPHRSQPVKPAHNPAGYRVA